MKKLILVTCLVFTAISLFGQSGNTGSDRNSEINLELKPLIILKFNNQELDLGFENGEGVLSSFGPELMKSLEIYKKGATTEKYGERGKNGVVVVTLKNGNDSREIFKRLKSGESLPILINTKVDKEANNHTAISLPPSIEVVGGVIKFKGEKPTWLTTDNTKQISIAVALAGKRVVLDDLQQLRPVNEVPVKSIELIQTTETTAEQYYDMLLVTLKKNSVGKRFFRKLKRSLKK